MIPVNEKTFHVLNINIFCFFFIINVILMRQETFLNKVYMKLAWDFFLKGNLYPYYIIY